jgi:O-antigen/teichoic acid export membrane protein
LSAIKRLAGETALYGLGSIVPRAINFFLTWLHTRVFVNPEEYGVITNLYAYVAFLNIVYIFGMETAFFRFATKPGADPKRIFNIAQTVVTGVSIFLSVIFILFSKPIAVHLNIPGKEEYIVWLALVMLFDAIVALSFAKLRLEKKPLQYALAKITNVVMFVGLNFFFLKIIYNPEVGVGYVFLANLIANAFFVLFFIRTLLQWRPTYDREVSPAMLKYAYPIMITGVAGMINEMFSRTTLELWLPNNFYKGRSAAYALGVFGACFKLAVIMNLAIQAFRFAAEPFFFSNATDKNSPVLFARVNHYFIIVCCVILLSVSINLDILKHFLGDPKYWEGLRIVPILLLAYVFLGIYYNLTVWFKLTDKTYYGTMIAFGGAVVTILANYILIPIAGYVGSSWATLICYASMTVACYVLGQKYFPIPYHVISGLTYIVLTTALVYIVNYIKIPNQWLAFGFHSVIICVYLLIIYLLEQKKLRQRVV